MSTSFDAQQPGLRAAQPARVDRAEQDRHHQMPERHLRAVAAAVGLREQRREFLIGVDVRDVTRGLLEHPGRQHVRVNAATVKPAGELPDRRDQALQRRGLHRPPARRGDPRLDRRSRDRLQAGKLAGAERVESGPAPAPRSRTCSQAHVSPRPAPRSRRPASISRAHWVSPSRAGLSGSSAHLANRPSDDFR